MKPIKLVPNSARLMFGKSELYNTDPITQGAARAVGEHLVEIELTRTRGTATWITN